MTNTGTVLFIDLYDYLWFVIDQSGLETGRLTLLQFQPNRQIQASTLQKAFNLGEVMTFHYGQGYPLNTLIEESIGGPPHVNRPYVSPIYPLLPDRVNQSLIFIGKLNMDLPILDILEIKSARGEFKFANWGNRETWSRDI